MYSLRKNFFFHAALLLASVLFLYFFSYSTSPRYDSWGNDSTLFQAVGKCWAEGLLPYVGAFENKGPLLFAINAIGYPIYPRVGIFFLQIPFMYFSLLFAWRAVELFWSGRATFLIFLFMFFWRASIFHEGNRTEEYSMPFLLAAVYFFLRRLKEKQITLAPHIGFIYGLGFGACVLMRTTNGLPICCYVLLTTIFLLHAREFKNIWQNFLSFCAGFAVICLPFVIYFAAHGALYDMIYGTILFNINHTTGFHWRSEDFWRFMVPYAKFSFVILFWMIAASLFALVINRKSRLAWSGLFASSSMLFLLLKGRPFYGYTELIIALLPLMFAVLYELKINLSPTLKKLWSIRGFSVKRLLVKAAFATLLIMVVNQTFIQVINLIRLFEPYNSKKVSEYDNRIKAEFQEWQKKIPAAERNSVVMWDESLPVCYFILETDIYPRCRFFGNVEIFGKSDPAIIDEWIQNVKNDYPKWILYGSLQEEFTGEEMNFFKYNFQRHRNPRVEEILEDKYFLASEIKDIYGQTLKLYRLRDEAYEYNRRLY